MPSNLSPWKALDRIEPAILGLVSYNMELRPDGSEDPLMAAYVEGVRASLDAVRAVLVEVSPEPGLAAGGTNNEDPDNLDPAGEDPTLRAEWPQRCGWDQCPGIPRREPIQDSGDGFHWHDICRKASVGQDAIHELTTLYRRLAQERKEGAEVSPEPGGVLDRDALGAAWDDGNAVGLDGWRGPGRGENIDPEAVRARERYLDRYAIVRPAPAGVSLTPEEAALLLDGEHAWPHAAAPVLERLRAARLEAGAVS